MFPESRITLCQNETMIANLCHIAKRNYMARVHPKLLHPADVFNVRRNGTGRVIEEHRAAWGVGEVA
jgi:hypothetical protein